MILEVAVVAALARQCAPSVAPETLVSIVHAESGFDPHAIGVNARGVAAPRPADHRSAATAARALIARRLNIDLGLGQINSANLRWLGLSIDDAFDPCRNLAAAARVLTTNYQRAVRSALSADAALGAALSMYNTGSRSRGFGNGYVGRVYASARRIAPALAGRDGSASAATLPRTTQRAAPTKITAAGQTETRQLAWQTSAAERSAPLMVFSVPFATRMRGTSE